MKSPFRVAVLHQGCIPDYREKFFELVNRSSEVSAVVYHGQVPTGSGLTAAPGPFAFPNQRVRNRELRLARWRLIYQPVIWSILRGKFDGLVVGQELKFVASLLLSLAFMAQRKPVILWGFGYHQDTQVRKNMAGRLVAGIVDRTKFLWTKRAALFLAYTQGGADQLAVRGMMRERIRVLRNTIDLSSQVALHQHYATADEAGLRRALGLAPGTTVLLFIGRLVRDKQVEVLIDFALQRAAGAPPVEIVIIGDGPERAALEARAGARADIHFWGRLAADDARTAQSLRLAAALIQPGYVGLAVNHAFAHGVPVITRAHDFHSPEIEYVVPGENGLVVGRGIADFFTVLEAFVRDPAAQEKLAEGALATRRSLGLDGMVHEFQEALLSLRASLPPRRRAASPLDAASRT